MNHCLLSEEGLIAYKDAWEKQKTLFNASVSQKINHEVPVHQLLVCEHPPVYTMGKHADINHLLLNTLQMGEKKVEVFEIERGGDITFHGPGQLVVYPIFDLEQLGIGVKQFVFNIEQCIINTLNYIGIESERVEGKIGIWIDKGGKQERKIAAIGIKCSRHITMHGLALNVNTDLNWFNFIVPCGIPDKSVTSIEKEFGRSIDMVEIKKILLNEFSTIFDLNFI
jgi:lipoyl(octanoyl) transferase